MKQALKIITLSMAIIIIVFVLHTNAATVNIRVEITGTAGTCVFGTVANLGATWYSHDNQVLSGIFAGTMASDWKTWRCYDSNGIASWNASMVMIADLENQTNTALTISRTWVSYSNYPVHQQAGSGSCTSIGWSSLSPNDWKYIGSSSQMIFQKYSSTWEVCRVQTTGLYLKVELPGGTNPGVYSGTIIITAPSF